MISAIEKWTSKCHIMKEIVLFVFFIITSFSTHARAEEFLGLSVTPGGRTLKSTDSILEKSYDLPLQEVVNFYKNTLKDQKDLKIRDRGHQVDFEDHGRLPWHKIVISGNEKGRTDVLIIRDNWTWIIGTLTIRFIGVFVVLLVLYLAMNAATGAIALSVRKVKT
ncbi:MAG: hypothetical protein ABII06_07985 [Pseudomonadota bacterium]